MKLSMNVMLFLILGLPSLLLASQADLAAQVLIETKNNQVSLEQSAGKLEGTLQKAQQLTEDAQELARLKTAESEKAKEAERKAQAEAEALRAKNQQLMGFNTPKGKKSNHSFSLLDAALATSLLSALTILALLFLKKKPNIRDASKPITLAVDASKWVTVTVGNITGEAQPHVLRDAVVLAALLHNMGYRSSKR